MVVTPIAAVRYVRPARIAAVALSPAPVSAPEPVDDRLTAARLETAMRIPPPRALSANLHPTPQRAVRPPPRLPAL